MKSISKLHPIIDMVPMKKLFVFLYFISFCSFAFSQENNSKRYEIQDLCSAMSQSIGIFGSLNVYLNDDLASVTIKNIGEKDEHYAIKDIPAKYFCIKEDYGGAEYSYEYSFNLPCIFNGKYGLINVDGVVTEPFKWDVDKYYFKQCTPAIQVLKKKDGEFVCSLIR